MDVYTIGFTKTNAEKFFTRLKDAGVRRLFDVRLNNVSQLAGFAKRDDLAYFLREIVGIDYRHMPEFAPTKEILDAYKKHGGDWQVYEEKFLELMDTRRVENHIRPLDLEGACLLCSEATVDNCHRRLVLEYLDTKWRETLVQSHL